MRWVGVMTDCPCSASSAAFSGSNGFGMSGLLMLFGSMTKK